MSGSAIPHWGNWVKARARHLGRSQHAIAQQVGCRDEVLCRWLNRPIPPDRRGPSFNALAVALRTATSTLSQDWDVSPFDAAPVDALPFDGTPVGLVRSRKRGFRLTSPNGLPIVCVTRPGKYGNPYYAKRNTGPRDGDGLWVPDRHAVDDKAAAVAMFERDLLAGRLGYTVEDVRRELRGKNLACYCPLFGPCHRDVLLRIANG